MGKLPSTKKDSFFIGKKQKNVGNLSAQKFIKKSHLFNKGTTTSTSGSFLVKSTETKRSDGPSKKTGNFFVKSAEKMQETKIKRPDKQKKTFDKKKWRLQKYSKKYKLEQWEERRKKHLLTEYYKQVENEPKFDVQKIYEKYADDEEDNDNENNLNKLGSYKSSDKNVVDVPNSNVAQTSSNQGLLSKSAVKKKARKNAHNEFERKQEEKKQKKEEIEKRKAEKAEAIKAYKQKKLEKYKKLNKKTKKGQPIMKYRMEMLLEQIQKSTQL